MTNYDFGVLVAFVSDRLSGYLCRVWLFFVFSGLLLAMMLSNVAQAACSSYVGKVVINEYNYIDNYIELKVIDPTVVASSSTFNGWTLNLYSSSTITGTTVSSAYHSTAAKACGANNDTYMRFNYGSNDMDGTAIVVLKDSSGNEVDYFRISGTGSYPTTPAATCSTFSYPTNGPLNVNSGKKGILRFADGTGNWIIGQGQGNNSEQSSCDSNNSLLSIINTPSSALVGIGSGSPFTWTAVVKNGGSSSLTNVQIVDELPAGLTFVSCSPSCSGNGSVANPYTITVSSLAAGASYTWSITMYASATGSYSNDIGATATELSPGYGHGIATVTATNASGFDHVRLDHAGSGVTCVGSQVTVNRCSSVDTSGSCVLYSPNTSLTGNVTAGSVIVSFTIAANSSSTTVSVPVTTAQTVTLATSGLSATPTNAQTCWDGTTASCNHIYSNSGFIFSNLVDDIVATIPSQIAGTTSATYFLRAVKTNTTTKACEAALSAPSSVNLDYQCSNPNICSTGNYLDITPYNGATAQTLQTVAAGGTATSLYFDANGNAPFTFSYRDVGQITLTANKAAAGSLLTALSGSSNGFVVKPDHFAISNIKRTSDNFANPVAASATDAKFVKAGEAFTASVTAMTSANVATPNFGKETSAEGVILARNLVLPAGATGTLSNATISGSSFSSGAATVANLAWNEVGIITLTPSIADADYLGVGDVSGITTGNIGRFYPDHFALTQGAATPSCGTFTYFGEDGFSSTAFMLTAQSASNSTTQNYTGSFAKLGLTWNDFVFTSASLPAGSALTASATAPTGSWSNGVATITAKHQVNRPTALTGETLLTIKAKPVDSDGVTLATATDVAGSTPLRYGRVFLQNTYGSELLDLSMPMTAQYWNGSSWITNTADSCTNATLSFAAVGVDITTKKCVIESANNSGKGCATVPVISNHQFLEAGLTGFDSNNIAGFAGNFNLWLKDINSTANTGSLKVTANVPSYLQGAGNTNPTARATFGIYKGNDKQIYFRELY